MQFDNSDYNDRLLFTCSIIEDSFSSGFFKKAEVLYLSELMPPAIRGYFILNHNFKKWRMPEEHRTANAKIAALTALAVLVFSPLQPQRRNDVREEKVLFCSEIVALQIASEIAEFDIIHANADLENFWFRVLEQLRFYRLNFSGLNEYMIDIQNGQTKYDQIYFRELTPFEKQDIISLINLFESLVKDGKSTSPDPI